MNNLLWWQAKGNF